MTDKARRPAHRPSRKHQLLAMAREEFASRGLDAPSVAEIAERADMTPGAAYYHFATKDEVVETLVADVYRSILDLLMPQSGEDVLDQWVRGSIGRVGGWIESAPTEARFLLVVAEAPQGPADLERQRRWQWDTIETLADVVKSYKADVTDLDAAVMAAALLALVIEWARTDLDFNDFELGDAALTMDAATHVAFRALNQ